MTRTVALATSLNRDSIMAAFKARRFYASDDWNAQVNFSINGNYMGRDFVTTNNSNIAVTITDPDAPGDPNDNINKIEIYYGIAGSGVNATILASNTGSTTLNYSHTSSINTPYYYFARITQVGGDIIWTAPIWVYRNGVVVPISLTRFTGIQQDDKIKLNWTTAQEVNAGHFDIERSFNGTDFQKAGMVYSRYQNSATPTDYEFFDAAPVKGMNFYRLKQVDRDGNFNYSDIIPVLFSQSVVKDIRVSPNPVNNNLNIRLTTSENATILCKIYNADGREVKSLTASVVSGNNIIATDVSNLSGGSYMVVLISNNERIAETKFIKQ